MYVRNQAESCASVETLYVLYHRQRPASKNREVAPATPVVESVCGGVPQAETQDIQAGKAYRGAPTRRDVKPHPAISNNE